MKNQKNEIGGKKEFNITLKFEAYRDGEIRTEDLSFTAFELVEKTLDESILKALDNLKLDAYEVNELNRIIGIDEETIKRFAKESKSLNDFKLLVYRRLLRDNWKSLVTTYEEDEYGCGEYIVDTTIKMEDILAEKDFKYKYGCEFEIEEILPCSGKVFRYEATMGFVIKSGTPPITNTEYEKLFNFEATRKNFDATFLKIVGDVYEEMYLEKESIPRGFKNSRDEDESKMYKEIYELARKVKSRKVFLKKLIGFSCDWWLSECRTKVEEFDIAEEQLDKKVKDFLDSIKDKAEARKLEILKKVRETSDPIEIEKLSKMYLELI
jgi:hypothetical protein